jgi:membrane protein required for colicin V production
MNAIDIIILVPMAYGAYKGYKEGLLMELVTLFGFVLATVLSFKLFHKAVELITPYIGKNESVIPVLGFLLIFVGVLVGVLLIGKTFKSVLNLTLLGTFDNAAGAIVGALKWAFGFSTVLWLMDSAGIGLPQSWTDGSFMYPYFVKYGPLLIDTVSTIVPYAQELVKSIKETVFIK